MIRLFSKSQATQSILLRKANARANLSIQLSRRRLMQRKCRSSEQVPEQARDPSRTLTAFNVVRWATTGEIVRMRRRRRSVRKRATRSGNETRRLLLQPTRRRKASRISRRNIILNLTLATTIGNTRRW
jgi:hypothetical protein